MEAEDLPEKSYKELAIKRDRYVKEIILQGPLFRAFRFDMFNRTLKANYLVQTGQLREEEVNKFLTQVAPDRWSDLDGHSKLGSFSLYVGDVKVKWEVYNATESLLQKSTSPLLEGELPEGVVDARFPRSMKFFMLNTTAAYSVLENIREVNATLTDLEFRILRYLDTVDYSASSTLRNLDGTPVARREAVLRSFQVVEELRFEAPFNHIMGESVATPHSEDGYVVGMAVPLSEATVEREKEKHPNEVLIKSPGEILQENLQPSIFQTLVLLLNEKYVLRYDNPPVKIVHLFTQPELGSVLPATARVLTVTLFADILNILPPGFDERWNRKVLGQEAFQAVFLGMEIPAVWKGRVWRQPEMIAPWYRVPSSIGATKDPNLALENLITLVFSRELTYGPHVPVNRVPYPYLLSFDVRSYSATRVERPLLAQEEGFEGQSMLKGFRRESIIMSYPFRIEGKFVLQRPGLPSSIQEVTLRTASMEVKFVALWSDDIRKAPDSKSLPEGITVNKYNEALKQPIFLPSKFGMNRFWLSNILYYPLHELMSYDQSAARYVFLSESQYASARPWVNGNVELEISPGYAAKAISKAIEQIGLIVRTWMQAVVAFTEEAVTLSPAADGKKLDELIDEIITHRQGIKEAKRIVRNTADQQSRGTRSVTSATLLKEAFSSVLIPQVKESYRKAKAALPLATERFEKLNSLITKAKQRITEIEGELAHFSPLQDTSTRIALRQELQEARAFLNTHQDTLEDIHHEIENNLFEYAKLKRMQDREAVQKFWKSVDDGSRPRVFRRELELLRGGIGAYHGDIVAVPQQEDWENGVLTLVPAEGSVLPMEELTLVSMQMLMSGRDLASLMHTDLLYKFLVAKDTLTDPLVSQEVRERVEQSIFVVNTLAQGTGLAFESLQHARAEVTKS